MMACHDKDDKVSTEEDSLVPIRCQPHEPLYAGGVTRLVLALESQDKISHEIT